jgi:hypothetical protein
MNIPDHIPESLETILVKKNTVLKFLDADPGSGFFLTLDPGSGINIPDPQHWIKNSKKKCVQKDCIKKHAIFSQTYKYKSKKWPFSHSSLLTSRQGMPVRVPILCQKSNKIN